MGRGIRRSGGEAANTVNALRQIGMPPAAGLHVLTLTPFYPTHHDDAAGCFVAEPLAVLAKNGTFNTVLAAGPFYRAKSKTHPKSPEARWIRYASLPGGLGLPLAGAFLYAGIVGLVRELHLRHKIDVIHAHAPLPCGHAAMLLHEELGIPYVVTVHGLDAFSTVQVAGKAGEWCRRVSANVYRRASRVICISERVREQVLAGTNCRTDVVYNGVDAGVFAPPTGASAETNDSANILSVGNLIPIKGHESLLRAMGALSPEFADVRLRIVGDGPLRARLESLAKELNIAGRVQFLGRKSRAEVADLMRRCTVFALPSRYEGLGCVYLEALSAGKPVIACREQGIAEVIHSGENGILVAPRNPRELTEALELLLRDGALRRRMGAAGRLTVAQGFTLAHQAEQLESIYRECVG